MDKKALRREAFRFLGQFGENITLKINNICGKTAAYSVPLELYQKRTPRKNRALISWQTVVNNKMTLKQLVTFEGGIVVEFINNDYFNPENRKNDLFS